MTKGSRAVLLAGASALALAAAGGPAPAQEADAGRLHRMEALAHADAIAGAWRRLEDHILNRSAAATRWTGPVPPAATGWLAAWTERGVRARYCEDTLLVYAGPESLKGADHRSVQSAPRLYGGERGRLPALHWLENGEAEGAAGRAAVALPDCLSDARFGGALPSGRAALAGRVEDPHLQRRERIVRERRAEACPAGTHGDGRTMGREVRTRRDGRGNPVGDPTFGPWRVLVDGCRADYSEWERYTLACSWNAGPPHNRRMTGSEVWRRRKTVTAAGTSWGAPEFVSTSCWDGRAPEPPEPAVTVTARTESRSEPCPAGHTGTRRLTRTVTERSTRFPWDAAPIVQTIPANWIADDSGCAAVPPPGPESWDGGGGDGGDGSGGSGGGDGSGGLDGGSCGDDGGSGGLDGGSCGGGGDGGGGDGGGDCFLTTAVAERRGEPDGGPTLTALRRFRDGYMAETAERREMVAAYYRTAPSIVAAVPADHADWEWIGGRIDAAVAAIGAGDGDTAFDVYAGMMERLTGRWLGPDAEGER